MKTRTTLLALALATVFSGTVLAQDAMTEADIRAQLVLQGYTKINDLTFKDGTWIADVRSADGHDIQVHVDAKTGKAYTDTVVARLSETEIEAKLSMAGYTGIHKLKFEDGFWHAEADDPAGKSVEIKVDPTDGHVIGSEKD